MSTITIERPPARVTPRPPSLEPQDLLLRAAAIVRRGWCQFAMAVDGRGCSVAIESPRATRWCGLGAVERALWEAAGLSFGDPGRRMKGLAAKLHGRLDRELSSWGGLPAWNDATGRTAEEVAEMFERAAR